MEETAAVLWKWTPLLTQGFVWNLVIGTTAMLIGTPLGLFLGTALVSAPRIVRAPCVILTQILRNSPWLVLLFFVMYLTPYRIPVGESVFILPAWFKAAVGLGLPTAGYVAEITRGGLSSIPTSQWETAEALGFSSWQRLYMIIIPQSLRRMIPPWMNLYANVIMATVLANVVGVTEALTTASRILSAEDKPSLILPIYGYVLVLFLIYCSFINWLTGMIESRTALAKAAAT